MRPVTRLQHALRIRSDQSFGKWRDIRIVRRLRGTAIRRGNFDISFARSNQVQQGIEAGLADPERRLRSSEVVKHYRHGGRHDLILDSLNHGQSRVDLYMPFAPAFDPVNRVLKTLPANRGITLSGGLEIDPYAANPGAIHFVKRRLRRLLIDHGDAARDRAELLHPIKRAGIIRAVYAWMNDHDAVCVQRLVEGAHLRNRGGARGGNSR